MHRHSYHMGRSGHGLTTFKLIKLGYVQTTPTDHCVNTLLISFPSKMIYNNMFWSLHENNLNGPHSQKILY